MKVKILLSVFALSMSVVLSSYRSGAESHSGYNGTGANGSAGCSCHTPSTGLSPTVELDSAGVAVTSYIPGASYTVKISGVNNTGGTLGSFGFQLCTVHDAGAGTSTAAFLLPLCFPLHQQRLLGCLLEHPPAAVRDRQAGTLHLSEPGLCCGGVPRGEPDEQDAARAKRPLARRRGRREVEGVEVRLFVCAALAGVVAAVAFGARGAGVGRGGGGLCVLWRREQGKVRKKGCDDR